MKESSKLSAVPAPKNPWAKNENPIWLTSSISLSRNFEKYKFPSKLSPENRKQIVSLIGGDLLANKDLKKPLLLKAEDCTPMDKQFLFEHFLTTQTFVQAHTGEAFVIDDSSQFLTIINLRDHVDLILTDTHNELEKTLAKLVRIETELGKSLPYAYSPKFGFLTSDPYHSGTALVVQAFLQLPALIHLNQIDEIISKHKVDGISVTGLLGNPRELIGDLLVVSNSYTLGVPEDKIVTLVRTFATQVMVAEKGALARIQQKGDPELKDRVGRAFGLLAYSYQIEAVEALNALSLLKLGLEVGWIENISISKLNEIFFNCRRAHLIAHYTQTIPPEELAHKRADFLRDALKDAKLKV